MNVIKVHKTVRFYFEINLERDDSREESKVTESEDNKF